jgi:hypothetical protein
METDTEVEDHSDTKKISAELTNDYYRSCNKSNELFITGFHVLSKLASVTLVELRNKLEGKTSEKIDMNEKKIDHLFQTSLEKRFVSFERDYPAPIFSLWYRCGTEDGIVPEVYKGPSSALESDASTEVEADSAANDLTEEQHVVYDQVYESWTLLHALLRYEKAYIPSALISKSDNGACDPNAFPACFASLPVGKIIAESLSFDRWAGN